MKITLVFFEPFLFQAAMFCQSLVVRSILLSIRFDDLQKL